MCRITAITATNVPISLRALVMHTVLLHANFDNTDGWGITDGHRILKTRASYQNTRVSDWIKEFKNPAAMWLAHVRNASAGTELTDAAAHPFRLIRGTAEENNIQSFIGVHNGAFNNPPKYQGPNSDSWNAFNVLADQLWDLAEEPDVLTAKHFEPWLEKVGRYSAYAVGILYRNTLYMTRNKQRTLHAVPFGNGLLINTSSHVLQSIQDVLNAAGYGRWVSQEEPLLLPEDVLYTIRPGNGRIVDLEKLILAEPSATSRGHYNSAHWDDSDYDVNYVGFGYRSGNSTPSTGSTRSSTQAPTLPAPNTTNPLSEAEETQLSKAQPKVTRVDSDQIELSQKREVWEEIRDMCNPMRQGALEMWFTVFAEVEDYKKWYDLPLEALQAFLLFHKRRAELNESESSLSSDERRIVNAWNKKVSRWHEVDRLAYEFGESDVFFLHLPNVEQAIQELSTDIDA